jgi:hypothetical protein
MMLGGAASEWDRAGLGSLHAARERAMQYTSVRAEWQLDTGVHYAGAGSNQRFGVLSARPGEAAAGAERCCDARAAAAGSASDSR